MDELGSRIVHSDEPTFRCVPFYYMGQGIAYSLLFPVKDLDAEDEVSRDYIENIAPELRDAYLTPWIYKDFTHVDYNLPEPDISYFQVGHGLI